MRKSIFVFIISLFLLICTSSALTESTGNRKWGKIQLDGGGHTFLRYICTDFSE